MSAMAAAETTGFEVNGAAFDLPESGTIGATHEVTPATLERPGVRPAPTEPEPTVSDDTERAHPVTAWREALLADGERWPAHDLPSTARLVGLGLSMHARWSMKAWPSARVVAKRCGLSERAVRSGFEALEAAGWVAAVERGGVLGGRRTTVWRLLTPERPAEVTPESPAGVEGDDLGTSFPTSEPHAPTPAPAADELEEELGTELEGVSAAALAHSLIHHHADEAPATIQAANLRWGEARVTELVHAYAVQGQRFVYASDLRTRIDRDAPQRPRVIVPQCPICDGTGMVLPLGASTVEPCECRKVDS